MFGDSIYNYIADETFPKPVSLGARAVAWVESEVQDWILERITERDLELEQNREILSQDLDMVL